MIAVVEPIFLDTNTNNSGDFAPFASLISVIPLLSFTP
jgi:hypothetical protein